MQIGKTLYVTNRRQWRSWLSNHHTSAHEIWLIYYKKQSAEARIPYNDAVEEALCYGWIDSTSKSIDEECWAQRFTPRRKNSALSEMNKERVRRLIKRGRMTRFGLESIRHHLNGRTGKASILSGLKEFKLPEDILRKLKADPVVWKNFRRFSAAYKGIRVGWIAGARHRPEVFRQRLRYFLKMTKQNKKFGMVQ